MCHVKSHKNILFADWSDVSAAQTKKKVRRTERGKRTEHSQLEKPEETPEIDHM